MLAIDTSTFVAFLEGAAGADVDLLDRALEEKQACLPPAVLAELLSDPKLPATVAAFLAELPLLDVSEGYWQRIGLLRASVLKEKRKARLADSLIAQSCLDHELALITRDRDFKNFAKAVGLRIAR